MLNITVSLLVIYFLYLACGYFLQRRIVFPRHFVKHDPDSAERFPGLELWRIETEEGGSVAWFLPARGTEPDSPRPAVIFAYGNSELAEAWAPLLAPYRDAGIHVLVPDYRGYGFSSGTPAQKAIVSDYAAFYDRLAGSEMVDEAGIFFHGRSLGGGVVCALSLERRPAAIVLSSTFTSIGDMARRFLFPPWLMKDRFDNLEAVRRYQGPVLILHGVEDALTPFVHAERLKEKASDAKLAPLPGDHNNMDPYLYDGEAWRYILDFLAERGIIEGM